MVPAAGRSYGPTMQDHYAVLGVALDADAEAIKAAHRELARRCHPDVGGDEHEMMRINEAWRVLRSPTERAAYDAARYSPRSLSGASRATDGRLVLDFGRYAGWTLEDVAATDDDYLAWLERTPASLSFRAELRRVLDERRHALESLRPAAAPARRSWAYR